MQTRYCILLTIDELRSLSPEVKRSLAVLDPEFASLVGVPTEANPPATPTKPAVNIGGVNTVPADRNQPNQTTTVDPTIAAALGTQIPMPAAPPAFTPVVPSAMPVFTGVPPAPHVAQAAVQSPMPFIPGRAEPAPPQPVAMPLQQPAPPVQVAQPAPAYQPAPPAITPEMVKNRIIPTLMAEFGGTQVVGIINQAAASGVIPRPTLDTLTDGNTAQFLEVVAQMTGKRFA
jgi:hypothetical protein